MKIILLEDVKTLGKKGDIVEVNNGYARNYILPKKLGMEATGKNLNDLKLQKANSEKVAEEQLQAAKDLREEIQNSSVELKIKAGENGKLFGAVSTKEIAAAVSQQLNLEVDKKKIQLKDPIKSLGSHIVQIKLHKDVIAELKVKVTEA